MSATNPHGYRDYPALEWAAERMLSSRTASDPVAEKAGKLTPAQADTRARVAASLAAIWRGLNRLEEFAPLTASYAEIRADLAAAVPAAQRLATASPADGPLTLYAASLATIAAHMARASEALERPSIVICHEHNQIARARQQANGAGPQSRGGHHVARSAERAAQRACATSGPGDRASALNATLGPVSQAALL